MQDIKAFQNYILDWYNTYGRTHLPWRQTTDPYKILVSELMLQQTQVERVIPKYNTFLTEFPNINSLAAQPLSNVLTLWQGLGYNRRAKFLHQAAQYINKHSNNTFPETMEELQKLPGIGSYTASAIMTFAFNKPVCVIETNIRAVFIHHFFPGEERVYDKHLMHLIETSIYVENPRLWYSALMDYGSVLKRLVVNPTQRSKTYTKQSSFKDSPRKVRGEVIRLLTTNSYLSISAIKKQITGNRNFFSTVIEQLEKEGMILRDGNNIRLGE